MKKLCVPKIKQTIHSKIRKEKGKKRGVKRLLTIGDRLLKHILQK